MPCSSGSRRTPCRINSQSAKLICRAAALDTRQLSGVITDFPSHASRRSRNAARPQTLIPECTTLLQAAPDFRHQVLGHVNGKTAPPRSAVQDPTRVLFAGLTCLAVRADARSTTQTERAENCRKSVGR